MLEVTLTLIGVAVLSVYLYSRYRYSYWSSRGIPSPPNVVPFLGHNHMLASPDIGEWIEKEVYNLCRSGFCGLYDGFSPIIMAGDPEIIKSVMVKDFDHFTDRRIFDVHHENDKAMNEMLVNKNGEAWKSLRSIMSPTFTSGKLRSLVAPVCQKSDVLVSYCLQEASKNESLDMKDIYARFILETISTCAFGFESNCINDKDSLFAKRAALFSDFSGLRSIVKFLTLMASPRLFRALNMSLFPKEVLMFNDITKQAIAARRKGEKRGDFLDLLLEAQNTEANKKDSKLVLNDDSLVSQSVLFIIAGFDTSATALAFTSYLLAKNPEEQRRLREEVREMVNEHGGITYDGIMNAKFLEACVLEGLRRYPPAPFTERVCSKPYKVPGTSILIKKGSIVQIPIWAIHMDEQYWPEPEAFKPDRFMPENKENITNYTYLPFGVGPRNCIAMRFAIFEVKIALAKMILSVNFELAPGFEELKLSTPAGIIKAEGGVQLHLTPVGEE